MHGVVCRFGRVFSCCPNQVERDACLFYERVSQLDGPIGVCRRKAADEMVLECLDGAFGRIDLMIVWLHKLSFALLGLEEYLEGRSHLIVGDIEEGMVSLFDKAVEDRLEGDSGYK